MNSTKIGNYIKTQLKKKSISQEKLSEILGISSSAVSQALSGKNSFDIENLQLISEILDESLDVILNAGEERETRTEKLSKMRLEEFLEKDPTLNTIKVKDSKGLLIYDYVIKNKNIELIQHLQKYGINDQQASNLNYTTLLVQNDQYDILKKVMNQGINYYRITKEPLENLKIDERGLIEAIVKSKNSKIHDLFNLFNNQQRTGEIPRVILNAVELDQVYLIEKYIDKMKEVPNFKENFKNHLRKRLIKCSIQNKSQNCLKYLYNSLLKSDRESTYDFYERNDFTEYFEELFATKDLEFIKWYRENFVKNINNNQYHSDNHYSYGKIKHLIEDNDVELMEYAADFLNQKALDEALFSCKIHQIEIIKVLLSNGARITIVNAYSSNDRIILEPLTAIIKELFSKLSK